MKYSVVIPFYNEAENIPGVLDSVRRVMDGLGESYEVLPINDGSSDASRRVIDEAAANWPQVRAIHFAKNSGQAAALFVGLREARGDWILTMDGDGQQDPADFRVLLQRTAEADLVIGIRQDRQDNWLRRAMSRLANGVRGRLLRDHVTDTGCGLKAFRREVVSALIPIRTLYSFIPAMAVNRGFKVIEVPVRHLPRVHGRSNYGLSVFFWKPAADMLALWWMFKRAIPPVEETKDGSPAADAAKIDSGASPV